MPTIRIDNPVLRSIAWVAAIALMLIGVYFAVLLPLISLAFGYMVYGVVFLASAAAIVLYLTKTKQHQ